MSLARPKLPGRGRWAGLPGAGPRWAGLPGRDVHPTHEPAGQPVASAANSSESCIWRTELPEPKPNGLPAAAIEPGGRPRAGPDGRIVHSMYDAVEFVRQMH